jgi:hypothetical protein
VRPWNVAVDTFGAFVAPLTKSTGWTTARAQGIVSRWPAIAATRVQRSAWG